MDRDDDFLFRLRQAVVEGNRTNTDTLTPLVEENLQRVRDDIAEFIKSEEPGLSPRCNPAEQAGGAERPTDGMARDGPG